MHINNDRIMFKFEYKGDRKEFLSPILLINLLKDRKIDILKCKLYRNDKLITVSEFNYYLDVFKNMI